MIASHQSNYTSHTGLLLTVTRSTMIPWPCRIDRIHVTVRPRQTGILLVHFSRPLNSISSLITSSLLSSLRCCISHALPLCVRLHSPPRRLHVTLPRAVRSNANKHRSHMLYEESQLLRPLLNQTLFFTTTSTAHHGCQIFKPTVPTGRHRDIAMGEHHGHIGSISYLLDLGHLRIAAPWLAQ